MTAASTHSAGAQPTPRANVDQKELDKFQALSSKWWDPNSEFRPLHEINPLRLEWIDELAQLNGKRALDVGCGGGILAEAMVHTGAEVTGIDLAEKSLQVAKLHRLESGTKVDYQHVAAEDFAAQNPASFDVVTCMEMLEHVPDPAQTIEACARLVRPGGWVFFSTINRNSKAFLFAIVGAEYVLQLLPRGTHDYRRFLKPSEIGQSARRFGLHAEQIIGMTYNPVTKVYKLDGTDVSVNYLMAFRKSL